MVNTNNHSCIQGHKTAVVGFHHGKSSIFWTQVFLFDCFYYSVHGGLFLFSCTHALVYIFVWMHVYAVYFFYFQQFEFVPVCFL